MRKRAYRAVDVKSVVVARVLEKGVAGGVTVGLDVGKEVVLAVVRWSDGSFERPWKVANPAELRLLVEHLRELSGSRELVVALEPTGTYGDALRQALSDAGLKVWRVAGKASRDYAEIFDGVPSQHDGKDAAVVAELAALGKGAAWPVEAPTELDSELAYWVDVLDARQVIQTMWLGRLEALVARHWPELHGLLELTSVTLLRLLTEYGGPAALAADPEARKKLASWGRPGLKARKIELIVESAERTLGVRQNAQDVRRLKQYASEALAAHVEMEQARGHLERLAAENATLGRLAIVVGTATACVLWVLVGDPRRFHCGEAYRKAMGMNLKERSSGTHKGKLKITKRGPGAARRWLYFAAMRAAQRAEVKRWYEAKKGRDGGRAKGALVAVARRLVLAAYRVAVEGKAYEPWRLFPGRNVPRGASRQATVEVSV